MAFFHVRVLACTANAPNASGVSAGFCCLLTGYHPEWRLEEKDEESFIGCSPMSPPLQLVSQGDQLNQWLIIRNKIDHFLVRSIPLHGVTTTKPTPPWSWV